MMDFIYCISYFSSATYQFKLVFLLMIFFSLQQQDLSRLAEALNNAEKSKGSPHRGNKRRGGGRSNTSTPTRMLLEMESGTPEKRPFGKFYYSNISPIYSYRVIYIHQSDKPPPPTCFTVLHQGHCSNELVKLVYTQLSLHDT